ncbi:MAG: TrkH family potassium uptake protein [Elusimicrobiota bacterium]
MPPKKKNFNPSKRLIKLFLLFILAGTVLLKLPVSTVEPISIVDALFTATSAVCVTGLTVQETGTFFTPFGQIVILILIQIGALGYMSLASLLVIMLRRGINIKEKLLVQHQISGVKSIKISKFILRVVFLTLIMEVIGAALLFQRMGMLFQDTSKRLYFSIFHAVSAFCNAGFDVFGGGVSLTPLRDDVISVLLISILIITGGIGYIVINDLIELFKSKFKKKRHRLSVHSKIVLTATAVLLLVGTVVYLISEFNNPKTIGNLTVSKKLLMALFQSVTPRTAGFNMIDTQGLINFSIIFTIVLMFIGASPGGTGGGIKTTTFVVMLNNLKSIISDKQDITMFKRRLTLDTAKKTVAIFTLGIFFIFTFTLFISGFENFSVKKILFEVTSAFGTVGLSTGITDQLSDPSKLLVVITMFFGRLGPLTIGTALIKKKKKESYRYPEQEVAVG